MTVARTSVGRSGAPTRIEVVEIAAIAVVDEIVGAHAQIAGGVVDLDAAVVERAHA